MLAAGMRQHRVQAWYATATRAIMSSCCADAHNVHEHWPAVQRACGATGVLAHLHSPTPAVSQAPVHSSALTTSNGHSHDPACTCTGTHNTAGMTQPNDTLCTRTPSRLLGKWTHSAAAQALMRLVGLAWSKWPTLERTHFAGKDQDSALQPRPPATAHVTTDKADPQVCVGSACAAAAGVGVAAEHAVAAHRAGGVTPVLDALPVEPVVAHLHRAGETQKDLVSLHNSCLCRLCTPPQPALLRPPASSTARKIACSYRGCIALVARL